MHHSISNSSEDTERQNITVWNDLVSPRDLVTCLLVAGACVFLAALASSVIGGQLLFWGLGASVVGFTVNCLLVSPKREVTIIDAPASDGAASESLDPAGPEGRAGLASGPGADQ